MSTGGAAAIGGKTSQIQKTSVGGAGTVRETLTGGVSDMFGLGNLFETTTSPTAVTANQDLDVPRTSQQRGVGSSVPSAAPEFFTSFLNAVITTTVEETHKRSVRASQEA